MMTERDGPGRRTKRPERRSPMAGRKFAALSGIKTKQAVEDSAPPTIEAQPIRGRGRPAGKRSDPEYEPTTLLLRKTTKKAAFRMLEDTGAEQDLSELAEQLISNWIRERQT
jgi:hypothetical protein